MEELLILVDENDHQIGFKEKQAVHLEGLLHRAFSVFIFNSKKELLLQQRAEHKYHSPGIWSNTCCSHPKDGESLEDAAKRRLWEELSMSCGIEFKFSFIYKANFDNGLIEHEYDHVFFGFCDEIPQPNPDEVKDWKYMDLATLQKDCKTHPEKYSAWLNICLEKVIEHQD